jgi:hypothetical protein
MASGNTELAVFVGILLLLAHGLGAQPAGTGEDHVQRQQEQQDSGRKSERRDAYPQSAQQRVACEREDKQDDRAQNRAPDRRLPLALLRITSCKRREDRSQPQRVHDHQQRHERVEDELEHLSTLHQ